MDSYLPLQQITRLGAMLLSYNKVESSKHYISLLCWYFCYNCTAYTSNLYGAMLHGHLDRHLFYIMVS
jgi:hypothetical protein